MNIHIPIWVIWVIAALIVCFLLRRPIMHFYYWAIAFIGVLYDTQETVKFSLEYHKKDPYRPWVIKVIAFKIWWWKLRGQWHE